jgi:programmed cell death protein 5
MSNSGVPGVDPAELERVEQLKKMIMRNILTKKARERLSRVRLVKPDLALQLEMYLVQLYQGGKLRTKLTDDQLKAILESLKSEKKFKIVKK